MSHRDAFLAQLQTARHALSAAADLGPGADLPAEHARAAERALAIVDGAIAALAGHIFSDGTALNLSSQPGTPTESGAPRIEERPAIHYIGVRRELAREELPTTATDLLVRIQVWLETRGHSSSGTPVIRYLTVESSGRLTVEIGISVMDPVPGHGPITAGVIPAGRYAVLVHHGGYEGLVDANAALQRWARLQGLAFDCTTADGVTTWAGRLERYTVGAETEFDPALWQTEVAYLLAGRG
jgi:hypothetical protein